MKRNPIGIALIISFIFLIVFSTNAFAAPDAQGRVDKVSFLAAFIIGLLYYLAQSPWLANLSFTVFYRPLIAGTLVGIVLGQPAQGVAIGATINVFYLGFISAGGSLPGDPSLAGYLGTALVIGSHLNPGAALALAAPVGLLGNFAWSIKMSFCSRIPAIADKLAEKGDIWGVARTDYLYSQPFLFLLYGVPAMILLYLGVPLVSAGVQWIQINAAWVIQGMIVASGMLTALGIAINLKILLQKDVWPFFFISFIIASMAEGNVNFFMFAIIGVAFAYLFVFYGHYENNDQPATFENVTRKSPGLLSRWDVFASYWRWLFFSHSTYNWERLQGLGFAHSMAPIIRKLYKKQEDIRAALKRHLVFFNTEPDFGGIIHGTIIAMEEDRAAGAEISDDDINKVKTSLMGPLAGIGDSIIQGIIVPVFLIIGIGIATDGKMGMSQGNMLGPIFYLVTFAAFLWTFTWWIYNLGYRKGQSAAVEILSSKMLNRIIEGVPIVGSFLMGLLAANFVKVSTPVVFSIGGTNFAIQSIVNQIMPNILSLLLILLIWFLITKRNAKPTLILFGIIVIGILGAIPLFWGIDPVGQVVRVGLLG
ncbi:MAG: PTS system mannose/fructose/sorbose family transporter subunit IID [Anaerolineaceae bacterium]